MNKGLHSGQSRSYLRSFLQSRLGLMFSCAAYIAVFVVFYHQLVVPVWGYEGFHDNASVGHAAIGWALALSPSLWLPGRLSRPSQIVYWLLYLLVVVPACIVPTYALDDQTRGPLVLATSLVVAFAFTGISYRLPLISLPRMQLRNYEFNMLLLLLSVGAYALIIARFGLRLHFVSFDDTYSVRAQFAAMESAPSAVGYAIGWQAWVINPIVMAIGLRSRRLSWLVTGAVGEFAIYSITAFRSMLFSAGLLLFLLVAMRSERKFGMRMVSMWTALFAGAGAIQLFGGSIIPESLVGVRMTALPGLLTGYYYEFFSSHPKAHLAHSIFKSFLHYPYSVEPPYLIGATYFHSAANDANAHVWADAYANFGYYGIICFTVLLAAILWMYDSMAVQGEMRLAALAIALPAFSLANGALLPTMLSNGMGLAMILIYLMPQDSYLPLRSAPSVSFRPARSASALPYAMRSTVHRVK
jgi:hypothetical protein